MNNQRKIWFFTIFIFFSCGEEIINKSNQTNVINDYLQGQLVYEYYKDSTIKEVYEANSLKHKNGRVLQFTPDGVLKRVFFINNEGDTVGDDSRFDSGILSEHYFRLNSESILFYAKFSEHNKLIHSEGRPFLLSGMSKIDKGDTVEFYIASPIIPNFITEVTFGQNGVEKSKVNYINDLRQFTNRKIMPEKEGIYEFYIQVQIKNQLGNTIIEDADTTIVIIK